MPPEGETVLDGLEIKVAFGNVWKESLTELSGGQRWGTGQSCYRLVRLNPFYDFIEIFNIYFYY